jgi:hypothetical protein
MMKVHFIVYSEIPKLHASIHYPTASYYQLMNLSSFFLNLFFLASGSHHSTLCKLYIYIYIYVYIYICILGSNHIYFSSNFQIYIYIERDAYIYVYILINKERQRERRKRDNWYLSFYA